MLATTERKIVKAAESPRGKWRLELQDNGDGSYRVVTLKRGNEQGCSVRHGRTQAMVEFQTQLNIARVHDGIDYKEARA